MRRNHSWFFPVKSSALACHTCVSQKTLQPDSPPGLSTSQRCDLGWAASPLFTFVSSSVKWAWWLSWCLATPSTKWPSCVKNFICVWHVVSTWKCSLYYYPHQGCFSLWAEDCLGHGPAALGQCGFRVPSMTYVSLNFSRTVGKVKWLLGVQVPENNNNNHKFSFVLWKHSHFLFLLSFFPIIFFLSFVIWFPFSISDNQFLMFLFPT